MSGLCETCTNPGNCCKDLFLSGGPEHKGSHVHDPMSRETAEHLVMAMGLPFQPLRQHPNGSWSWWCPNLLPTGRCGAYETRPHVCSSYEEGSSPLCVHYWSLET